MTAGDAVRVSQGFTRLLLGIHMVFLGFSLGIAGFTLLSPEIHETLAYAGIRKIIAVGYALPAVTMLLSALWLTGRSNAALRLGEELMLADPAMGQVKSIGLFKPLSGLWALFFMTAIMIAVVYVVLIYAVDGGIF